MGEPVPGIPAGTDTDQGQESEEESVTGQENPAGDESGDGTGLSDDPTELKRQLALARKDAHRFSEQARINAKKAASWDKAEKANMTELERAQAAQKEAEEERDKAIASHHRVMAAAMHDLPAELIDELGTGSSEEIEARAEMFANVIEQRAQQLAEEMVIQRLAGEPYRPGTGNGRPTESLQPGGAPTGHNLPQTPEDQFRAIFGR